MTTKISTSTYKPGMDIKYVQEKYRLKNVIKLASNENPCGPSKKAIKEALKIIKTTNRYPEGSCKLLKSKLKKFLGKSFINEKNLIIGNGSSEILELIARTYLNKDAESLFSKHSFIVYKIISNSMQAKIIESRVIKNKKSDYMNIDLTDMKNKITKKTKIIFIANPSNPIGKVVDYKDLENFIKNTPKRIIIVIDEAYFEYASYRGYRSTLELLKKYKNLIITRSFSKIYALAGHRIGYGIASGEIINRLNAKRQPFNVNSIAQSMATASLNDKSFVKTSLTQNDHGRLILISEFKKLKIFYIDTHTNFITIYLGTKTKKVFEKLLSLGVILRPLDNYGLKNFLRVTIGTKNECQKFIRTLKTIMSKIS
tara:strand:+ start:1208 stop:2317 length:1110 start_codon:yes stop_codon:yes gene_type:complete